jgi:hypothetical protein
VAAPPYAKKSPKPTVEDLEATTGMSRAGIFRRLRTYLCGRPDVVEDLHHYGTRIGWGLRYRQKASELCAVVLWPQEMFALVTIPESIEPKVALSAEVGDAAKALLRDAPEGKGGKTLRLSLEDRMLVADFRAIVLVKGGGAPPRRRF